MENNNHNKSFIWQVAIAVIIVIAIIAVAVSHKGSEQAAAPLEMSPATSTPATTTPAIIEEKPTLAFAVRIASTTYSQDQSFPIDVSVLNLTDASTTLSFKDGCMGTYTIGDFSMIKHTMCTMATSSFVVAPHAIQQVRLVHYPSVYKIPVGTYTLNASIIGYGGNSVKVTIIK